MGGGKYRLEKPSEFEKRLTEIAKTERDIVVYFFGNYRPIYVCGTIVCTAPCILSALPGPIYKAVHTAARVAGTESAETGESWCSDCREADAVIRRKVSESGMVLVEVPVGDRATWLSKDPANFYKKEASIKVESVPFVVIFKNSVCAHVCVCVYVRIHVCVCIGGGIEVIRRSI